MKMYWYLWRTLCAVKSREREEKRERGKSLMGCGRGRLVEEVQAGQVFI